VLIFAAALVCRAALADVNDSTYDAPAGYYPASLLTSGTLKSDLHNIIDGQTTRTYDQLRADLQVTDADPNDPTKIRVIYNNGVTITKKTVGSIPGWDGGTTWNREHSWPQNRGVDTTGEPDGTDMFHLFPSKMTDNSTRGDRNYAGTYGVTTRGIVGTDGYYPGDADAGLLARAEFYMDVRYNGTESGTQDLQLVNGQPAAGGNTMGDLASLLAWHFAAPPDEFERKRNKIIYSSYQGNRNPFIDHPEYAWAVFAKDSNGNPIQNNSQITIASPTSVDTTTGASTKTVNLGRVIVAGAMPSAQTFTINKAGSDGTYYEVTTGGLATSTVVGRYNAFRTNQIDSKQVTIGLNTTTASAGLRSGTVTVDNLDITPGSNGGGHGANDANDVFNVSLSVLDHAIPSLASTLTTSTTLDFGNIALGSSVSPLSFSIFNLNAPSSFTAGLDLDSISGTNPAFSTNLATFSNLAAGSSQGFTSSFNGTSLGTFQQTYTLTLSDENLSGATGNKTLTLTLKGKTHLAGDFNGDGEVDSADYVTWRGMFGRSVTNAYDAADGNGNKVIDNGDVAVWQQNFGLSTSSFTSAAELAVVPEPSTIWLAAALLCFAVRRRQRCA
jgi:endonuclease I